MSTRRAALLGLLAAGCTPLVQVPGVPVAGFAGPAIVEGPQTRLIARDGARLGLTVWPAQNGA